MADKILIEVMDTTLRDGEQMYDVAFAPHEKLSIAKLLLTQVNVDRVEVASAKSSKGEEESVRAITNFAKKEGMIERIEILGFVDNGVSIDWIKSVGGKVINMLTKGSLLHCEKQLKKTPKEHFEDIKSQIKYAQKCGLTVNVYLETWSNGIQDSPDYVFDLVNNIKDTGIKRIMLPDTLGILQPLKTIEYTAIMAREFPGVHFDFHAHNDYGLATANTLAAVYNDSTRGVHVTVNGMGERAGNASMAEVHAGIADFMTSKYTHINEKKLYLISRTVEMYSGHRVSKTAPILGENAFTQTAGIHADGDKKGNLYVTQLSPERFSRERIYALGKLSGKSNLDYNLNALGIELSEENKKKLLERIIQLGDMKKTITNSDLPYIIEDVIEEKRYNRRFQIEHLAVLTAKGLKPIATLAVQFDGKKATANSDGDGGYDAFMRALNTLAKQFSINLPQLDDYHVTIPPGGKTDALVETAITWRVDNRTFKTRGVNSDQVMAAVEATEKMINQILFEANEK